jgi:hypothetical protein
MIYLASPYTHKDPDIVAARVLETQRVAVHLWVEHRKVVFSPIMHWHHAAIDQDLPTDAKSWQDYNEEIMMRCDAVYLLCLDGWESSVGMKAELEFATTLNLPIITLNPNTL